MPIMIKYHPTTRFHNSSCSSFVWQYFWPPDFDISWIVWSFLRHIASAVKWSPTLHVEVWARRAPRLLVNYISLQVLHSGYLCTKICSCPWLSTTLLGFFGKHVSSPFGRAVKGWGVNQKNIFLTGWYRRYNVVLFHPSHWQKESQVYWKINL